MENKSKSNANSSNTFTIPPLRPVSKPALNGDRSQQTKTSTPNVNQRPISKPLAGGNTGINHTKSSSVSGFQVKTSPERKMSSTEESGVSSSDLDMDVDEEDHDEIFHIF